MKQQRPTKTANSKLNSPVSTKKETQSSAIPNGKIKTAQEVERHSNKIANISVSKLVEPKVRVTNNKRNAEVKPQPVIQNAPLQTPNTGIPKPTAAVKGTTKVIRDEKSSTIVKSSSMISRENSQMSMETSKPAAMVSPMKNEKEVTQLSESSNSASTGQHSNSSESSVIYKPSSESGSEQQNVIPNRKEPVSYLSDVNCLKPQVEEVDNKKDKVNGHNGLRGDMGYPRLTKEGSLGKKLCV